MDNLESGTVFLPHPSFIPRWLRAAWIVISCFAICMCVIVYFAEDAEVEKSHAEVRSLTDHQTLEVDRHDVDIDRLNDSMTQETHRLAELAIQEQKDHEAQQEQDIKIALMGAEIHDVHNMVDSMYSVFKAVFVFMLFTGMSILIRHVMKKDTRFPTPTKGP